MKIKLTSVTKAAVAGLALLGATSSLQAATITVTSTADSGAGSLRAAIASAVSGDTINFAVTGKITLISGELLVNKNLTILGPGPSSLAVDGNAASRVFRIAPSALVGITGLTITNGYGDGGGLYNDQATLSISNSVLSGNSAFWYGGGIWNAGGTLTIVNSTLSSNSVRWYGGAICNSGQATLTVSNCTLSGNSADVYGGAIANAGYDGSANAQIVDCTIRSNSGGTYGGGIYNGPSGSVQVFNSTISGNSTYWYGGAVCNEGSSASMQVIDSTLSGNSALWYGSAICNQTGGGTASVQVVNSTLSGNVGRTDTGAICNQGFSGTASVRIVSSTLSGNSGRGIVNSSYGGVADVQIASSVLNADALGAINIIGSVTSLGYNLSSDTAGGWLTAPGDQTNTDPMLGPLQDNGGPTFTHALLAGSPAIDRGKNLTASPTDQRGLLRTFDDPVLANAAGGDGTDVGAFEVQTHLNLPPVARAAATPAFEPLTDTNSLWFTVVSANNTNASVTLDGSASSDPEGDPLTFAWSMDSVSFSTNAVTTRILDVGWYVITLTVNDIPFLAASSTTITVELITASQAIEPVIWAVADAGIRRQDSQPLIVSLKSASEAFDRGSIGAGVNKLQAFQEKVAELVAPTNPAAAAALIALAQQVIDAINAQPAP